MVGILTVLKEYYFPDDRWGDLGLKLGIIQTELVTIKKDNQNSNDRLKACLTRWLYQNYDTEQYGKPTMESLAAAVRGMGLKAVAEGIDGKQPVPTQKHELSGKFQTVTLAFLEHCTVIDNYLTLGHTS